MPRAEKNVLLNVKRQMPFLNPALKRVAAHVLADPQRVKLQRITEVASDCQVSEASVMRFVKKLDFDGFPEFKIAIAGMLSSSAAKEAPEERFFYDDLKEDDSIQTVIQKVAFKNIQSLKDTQELLDPGQIEKGIAAIKAARVVALFCAGTSTVAGHAFKLRFYRIGKHCLLYSDPIEQAVTASLLDKKSLAVGISSSGRTQHVVDALKTAKGSGAATMCITDSSDSPIVKHSDIRYFTFSKHSDFLQDSLISRMSQILIIDTLYACYVSRHYDRSLANTQKSSKAVERATKSVSF